MKKYTNLAFASFLFTPSLVYGSVTVSYDFSGSLASEFLQFGPAPFAQNASDQLSLAHSVTGIEGSVLIHSTFRPMNTEAFTASIKANLSAISADFGANPGSYNDPALFNDGVIALGASYTDGAGTTHRVSIGTGLEEVLSLDPVNGPNPVLTALYSTSDPLGNLTIQGSSSVAAPADLSDMTFSLDFDPSSQIISLSNMLSGTTPANHLFAIDLDGTTAFPTGGLISTDFGMATGDDFNIEIQFMGQNLTIGNDQALILDDFTATSVPEPSSSMLVLAGCLLPLLRRKR